MGCPKHCLRHQATGQSLLDWQLNRLSSDFGETLLLVGDRSVRSDLPSVRVLVDPPEFSRQGPLVGLWQACLSSRHEQLLLLAIDYPDFDSALCWSKVAQAFAQGSEAVVFRSEGRPQWLASWYRSDLAAKVQAYLEAGGRSLHGFCQELRVGYLAGTEGLFSNLNTPEQATAHGFMLAQGHRPY